MVCHQKILKEKHDKIDIKKSFKTNLKGLAFVIHGLYYKKINVLALCAYFLAVLLCTKSKITRNGMSDSGNF